MRQRANNYYALQQILLGDEGISAIKKARVLMIGVGGLGCPAAMHLTTTGVGRLTLLDPDVVETSNLHRQTLYRPGDEGLPKVSLAARRLQEINPDVEIVPLQAALNPDNAERLIPEHDLVLDGSDNFATKFLCADACARLGKTLVYAAVFRFQGQLAVFDDQIHYRDLFPHVPDSEMVPDCSDGGTVGAFVALIGTMQAAEAIKIISGVGENLRGKLFVFDTLTFRSFKLTIVPNPENPLRSGRPISPSDYEHRCANIATLAPETLAQWNLQGRDYFLLDVRTSLEATQKNYGGTLIPIDELDSRIGEIPRNRTVVVHCQTGVRSRKAAARLALYGFSDVYALTGTPVESVAEIRNER